MDSQEHHVYRVKIKVNYILDSTKQTKPKYR